MKLFKKLREELGAASTKPCPQCDGSMENHEPDCPSNPKKGDKETAVTNPKTEKGKPEMSELSMSMKSITKTGLSKKASSVDKDKLKKDLARLKKGVNEVSSDKLGAYMRKSAADAAKPGASARRQDKRIGGQSMADKKIRKKMGYSSTAKVPAGTNEDDASARMYRDNPDMMKQQGPGGFKSLDKKMQKTIKQKMKKLPPKPTKENVDEGPARDRLMKAMDKASGRNQADREADAKAATARRKAAEKDLASFRKKNNM